MTPPLPVFAFGILKPRDWSGGNSLKGALHFPFLILAAVLDPSASAHLP